MKTTIALTLMIALMAAGCVHRNARETLQEADRLVNEQPDSALKILEQLARCVTASKSISRSIRQWTGNCSFQCSKAMINDKL